MTTNQTIGGVSRELRELLERVATEANHMLGYTYAANYDECRNAVDELRALLDADKVNNRQMGLMQFVEAHPIKAAAQPLGEPVAWVECSPAWLNAGGDCANAPRLCVGRGGISHLHPAHAEQPSPVAVLPERLGQVLKFLDGAENLDGHWFGEPHPSGRPYWWRNELRKALAETNLFAKQQ